MICNRALLAVLSSNVIGQAITQDVSGPMASVLGAQGRSLVAINICVPLRADALWEAVIYSLWAKSWEAKSII